MYRAKVLLVASGFFLYSDVFRPAHAIFPNQPSKEALTVATFAGGHPVQQWVQYLGTGESGTVVGLTVSVDFEKVTSNSALQVSLAEFSTEADARLGYGFRDAITVRRVKILPSDLFSTQTDYSWNFVEEGEVGPAGHPVQRGVFELKPDKYYSIAWVCSGDRSGCNIGGSLSHNAYRDADHGLKYTLLDPTNLREDSQVKDAFFVLHPEDPSDDLRQKAADLAKQMIGADYLGDGDTFGGKGWDPERCLYASPNEVRTGYHYWNNKLREVDFGAGLDCSGLVQWSFNRSFDPTKSLLHNIIRYDGASGQYRHNSEAVPEEDLKPSDLLFFGVNTNSGTSVTHVAMYVGDNGTFDVVHAADPRRGIITSTKDELKSLDSFLGASGFRRVVFSPSIGGSVKAGSPIDLALTDPDGLTITAATSTQTTEEFLREVPGELYYWESEIGSDGRPEAVVYWPTQKAGDYIVRAIPQAGASPTSTYSLTFQSGSTTIPLAQNMSLSQIPSQGYGITVSTTGIISSFIPVVIDIKPASYPNSINLRSNGVVPFAIFGSKTLDVYQIDPATIKLAGASIQVKPNGQLMSGYSDVDGDGFIDLVAHVSTQSLELSTSDDKGSLEGFLFDGQEIKGSDTVQVVPR